MKVNKKILNSCKIVATLGLNSEDMIEKMLLAGVSVFRINLSHATLKEAEEKVNFLRLLEKKYNKSIGIFLDLQGPKLRVGTFINGAVNLKAGQIFNLDLNAEPGNSERAELPHPEVFAAAKNGMRVLFNDGLISSTVLEVTPTNLKLKIVNGGVLTDNKGVNIPDVLLPVSALTLKDTEIIKEANNLEIDWFALSFIQKPEDILQARKLISPSIGIIGKIEKPQALENLESIISLCDAVLIARGDLGVELSAERVPLIQRQIVEMCRQSSRPVIVATQMLESMIYSPRPTRAETSDVASAVYEGADAVMLSAETAVGKYPLEAVKTMRRIITVVESDPSFISYMRNTSKHFKALTPASALAKAAGDVANFMDTADLIVNFTAGGITTIRTAAFRPCLPIFSLTPFSETARKMTLVCGAHPKVIKTRLKHFEDIETEIFNVLKQAKLATKGLQVVVTAGIPFGKTGDTNLLYILALP